MEARPGPASQGKKVIKKTVPNRGRSLAETDRFGPKESTAIISRDVSLIVAGLAAHQIK